MSAYAAALGVFVCRAQGAGAINEPLLLTSSSQALPQQPVVKVVASTETGDAPRGQGATTENIGLDLRESQ